MQNQTRNLVIVALVAALVAVTCWNQSTGQGEPAKPAGVKWEYMTIDAETKTLNEYADIGWEVSAGYSQQRPGTNKITGHAIIRRPKAAK